MKCINMVLPPAKTLIPSLCRLYGLPITVNSPPWKGDYHHDLNTQLSYWPTYTGNHLTEGLGYLNTLWNQRDVYKEYTRQYFETDGMNVPGVCTLLGVPMGGWIQYSMSQTAGAWLAQHFYLHWKYSMDRDFPERPCLSFPERRGYIPGTNIRGGCSGCS